MADEHRRRVKSDDSEGSFSESEDGNDVESSAKETPEKGDAPKTAGESEYESAEEEEEKECDQVAESDLIDPECQSEELELLPDEEGGEEGIAENEEVEEDFLNGDALDNASDDGEDYVEEERQQGDGEECSPSNTALEKELDFDEDRRNPQYIPKKGIFYEHDDRNNEDEKEKEEEPTSRDKKKKLWLDEGKWGHDRFREEEQTPKSRGELIEIYGYDIRCEEGPPRARRRRRYGRGPTKYERNWEDVTAYGREKFKGPPRIVSRGRRSLGHFRGVTRYRGRDRNGYENEGGEREGSPSEELIENDLENKELGSNETPPIINNRDFPALPQWYNESKDKDTTTEKLPEKPTFTEQAKTIDETAANPKLEENSVRTLTFENSSLSSKHVPEYEVPPRRIKTSPFRGNYRSTGQKPMARSHRGGRGDYARRGRSTRHISPRFLENRSNNINSAMAQLSMDDVPEDVDIPLHHQAVSNEAMLNSMNVNELQNSMPSSKSAGDSSGRPKRYSSLRQRSLPETNAYPTSQPTVPTQHPTYYDAGYQPPTMFVAPESVPPSSQGQTVASPSIMNPSAYQTFATNPYPDGYGIRIPVASPPRLFPQATVPAGQPILAPPPACITPSPNIMNFAPPPAPSSYHQFTYQQYATPPPPPPPAPPNDLFRGGITYYYPHSQPPPAIRPTVQKRPKAAIPILPPPESEGKRKEKKDSSQNQSSTCNNFVENTNDSIDPGIATLRTESSTLQLQSSVGVES